MAAPGVHVSPEVYLATCWNCLGEFDALAAVWCSDDPKTPTKLCPFCLHCFCDASERFKREFWRNAPPRLLEELQTLNKSRDRLGDILIRMKKITTSQLLDALMEQRRSSRKLGEILVDRRVVRPDDVQAALRSQGNPLTDTRGVAYASSPVWDQSGPDAIIQYILQLAARKGASDVHLEPTDESVTVKYRIDGFFFRVDPIPKAHQEALTQKLFEAFQLNPALEAKPQTTRTRARLGDTDYDLVVQTLPTPHGVSATIKLVNRATFIKDFATLGLDLEDRVRLMEELRGPFGLVLVTAPVFNGATTTAYSVMNFLVQGQERDVVSLEAPIQWRMDGVRQVEVDPGAGAGGARLRMEETLRSVLVSRPDVILLGALPDAATAQLATQLASSVLVIAQLTAQSAVLSLAAFQGLGVSPPLLAGALVAATCQRLVRQICRICRQEVPAPPAQTLSLHGIGPTEAAALRFFRGKGCPTCNKVGYRGRRAVFEVLTVSGEMRAAIQSAAASAELQALAEREGMRGLRSHCLELVREGVTTFEEFVRLRL